MPNQKKLTRVAAKHKCNARAVAMVYKLKLAQHRKKLAQRKRRHLNNVTLLQNNALATNAILAQLDQVSVDIQSEARLEKYRIHL